MGKFCDLDKNIKHIGEVATGHVDGKPSGAVIDTSTNDVTGEERETLTGLLKNMTTSFDAQLEGQSEQFQDRFNTLAPVKWAAGLKVTNVLQVYSHTDGQGVERSYLPDPKLVPFTTGATFADDVAAGRFEESSILTQMQQWRFTGDSRGWGIYPNTKLDLTRKINEFISDTQNAQQGAFFCAGEYLHKGIISDATKPLSIIGEGFDATSLTGTVLKNIGTGDALTIINATQPVNYNHTKYLSNFALAGNASSRDGLVIDWSIVKAENFWSIGHGRHGCNAIRSFTSEFVSSGFSNNQCNGFLANRALNQVKFDHCIFNGNSKIAGFGGLYLSGAAGIDRNFSVVCDTCDFTGNGTYGFVGQYTSGLTLIGCYAESNAINIYIDGTSSGVSLTGGFYQDGDIQLLKVPNLEFKRNSVLQMNKPSISVTIDGGLPELRAPLDVNDNEYVGNISKIFTGGASLNTEMRYTSPPVGGTWNVGDFVRNIGFNNAGDVYGWVYTGSVWSPTNQTPSVYVNWGDSDAVLSPLSSLQTNLWQSPLTAARTVTLGVVNAFEGYKYRLVRTSGSTGLSALTVLANDNITLVSGSWCEVEFVGGRWLCTAKGLL